MSIIRNLRAGWKAMSGMEKLNFALDILAEIGCSIIAGDLASEFMKEKKTPSAIAIATGMTGLGIAAGAASAKAIDSTFDTIKELKEMRKQAKAEEKNGTEKKGDA